MNDFTFAHLSDPHLTSLEDVAINDLLNKRILGYLSWRMHRRTEHRGEILSALVEDLRKRTPDHVVVTGDLTHLGLPSEFQEAKEWLDGLGIASQVTVIPGNHEAYIATPWEDTFSLWANNMLSDKEFAISGGATLTPDQTFPTVRVRGQVAFIGLSSALPTAPFMATGTINDRQLNKLEKLLLEFNREDFFRVVLIHHPPLSGTVKWRKSLTNAEALLAILSRSGAELVLHGHAHTSLMRSFSTPHGNIPIVGVPSASAMGSSPDRRARYHIYRVKKEMDRWDISVSVYAYSVEQHAFMFEREEALHSPQACAV